jgi:stage IV sporulation protein FB
MRFRIDLKIFLFIALFYFTKQIETYSMIMLFAILHEFGHLLAGLLLGMKPEKMEIRPYGISISFKLTPKDYNKKIKYGNQLELKKIIVALAGPITNVIIMMIVLQMNTNIFSILMILYSNLLLILFNLLPIYPLDGGRIIKGILHICLGKRKAEKYTNYISFVTLILVTFVSSIAIYQAENIAIFLIILVLWAIFIKEDRLYERKNKIYHLLEKSIEIK